MNKIVTLEKVCKKLSGPDGEMPIISDISLSIESGEIVALVGPSGAGKSTLLQIVGTLDEPSSGRVLIDGFDVFSRSDKERSILRGKQIGFVFQTHRLLGELSALENVMLPLFMNGLKKNDSFSKAREMLKSVGLLHRESHLPTEMSGGERQRVALARALVIDPVLLLADEPTGALDTHNGEIVENMMFDLAREKKCAVMMVTHDLTLARKTDRVLSLIDGELK